MLSFGWVKAHIASKEKQSQLLPARADVRSLLAAHSLLVSLVHSGSRPGAFSGIMHSAPNYKHTSRVLFVVTKAAGGALIKRVHG